MIQYQHTSFTVFQSLIYKTTSTVIETEDCVIIVDPNLLPNEVEEIRMHVNQVKKDRPVYIIFTHSDWDHIIGYGAFPESITIGSEELVGRQDHEEIIKQIIQFDDQYYLERNYPIQYPKIDIVVNEEGQIIEIGKTQLTFYKAVGHTNDGIFIIVEPLGLWIAGDYFSDIEFPFIYSSSVDYEKTLNKMDLILQQHNILYLIPGHGHITNIKEEMKFRKMSSLTYIKELRHSIQFNCENKKLLLGYKYLSELEKCHESNIIQIKNELQNNVHQHANISHFEKEEI